MEKLLENYGILGIIVVALGIYILKIEARHKSERKEWRETIGKQFDRMNQQTDDNNKTTRENTNILQGLKTLLENKNRR
jgi:hypothetical protein